jgi:predicted cupin superfamily sugar epimerase
MSPDSTAVESIVLGPDLAAGERPQAVVPTGAWQCAEPVAGGTAGYALVGCTVAPPFRFEAFELAPPGWAPG